MATAVRYSIPVQGRSFLRQIGCGNTVPALHDMVLEDVVSDPLDNPPANTKYGLPIYSQIPTSDIQETRSLHI